MISKLALLRNLLLASVALAIDSPFSLPGASLTRRVSVTQSQYWGGASVHGDSGENITLATATFAVPKPWGDNGSAKVWVGLDGSTCRNGAIRAGVDIYLNHGVVSYDVWYQIVYKGVYRFPGISVNPGDNISVTIVVVNATHGWMAMENYSSNQAYGQDVLLDPPENICQEYAEWFVGDPQGPESFLYFDNLTFVHAMASGMSKTYLPSDSDNALIYNIVSKNETIFTYASAAASTIYVQRLLG